MLVAVVVRPTRPQAAETADMVSRICAEHGAASQALDVWQDEQSLHLPAQESDPV